MASCVHGFPKPSNCLDCMEDGVQDDKEEWVKDGTPFAAKYPGTCVVCKHEIKPGEDALLAWVKGERAKKQIIYSHFNCNPNS